MIRSNLTYSLGKLDEDVLATLKDGKFKGEDYEYLKIIRQINGVNGRI